MFSHVTVGSNDMAKSKAFYDGVAKPLGLVQHMEFPDGIGYGPKGGRPQLWIVRPIDKQAATVGNGITIGLEADTRSAVDAAYAAGMAAGGKDEGKPGPAHALSSELLRRLCSRSGRQQGLHRLPQAGVRRIIQLVRSWSKHTCRRSRCSGSLVEPAV